jgi:hypothetical protein
VENPVNECGPGISEKQRPYHADFDRDRKCSIRCHLRQAPPLSKHLVSDILPYAEQFEFVPRDSEDIHARTDEVIEWGAGVGVT